MHWLRDTIDPSWKKKKEKKENYDENISYKHLTKNDIGISISLVGGRNTYFQLYDQTLSLVSSKKSHGSNGYKEWWFI